MKSVLKYLSDLSKTESKNKPSPYVINNKHPLFMGDIQYSISKFMGFKLAAPKNAVCKPKTDK